MNKKNYFNNMILKNGYKLDEVIVENKRNEFIAYKNNKIILYYIF